MSYIDDRIKDIEADLKGIDLNRNLELAPRKMYLETCLHLLRQLKTENIHLTGDRGEQ